MNAALDHLVYVTNDLVASSEALSETWGCRLVRGGSHEGLGTANFQVSLGDDVYFELMGPDPAQGITPRLELVAGCTTPGLAGFVVRVPDLPGTVERVRALGYEPGEPQPMARVLPDGARLAWTLAVPPEETFEPTIPFLIDWGESPHPSGMLPGGVSLHSFTVFDPCPERLRSIHDAIGIDVAIEPGEAGFSAILSTPRGIVEL